MSEEVDDEGWLPKTPARVYGKKKNKKILEKKRHVDEGELHTQISEALANKTFLSPTDTVEAKTGDSPAVYLINSSKSVIKDQRKRLRGKASPLTQRMKVIDEEELDGIQMDSVEDNEAVSSDHDLLITPGVSIKRENMKRKRPPPPMCSLNLQITSPGKSSSHSSETPVTPEKLKIPPWVIEIPSSSPHMTPLKFKTSTLERQVTSSPTPVSTKRYVRFVSSSENGTDLAISQSEVSADKEVLSSSNEHLTQATKNALDEPPAKLEIRSSVSPTTEMLSNQSFESIPSSQWYDNEYLEVKKRISSHPVSRTTSTEFPNTIDIIQMLESSSSTPPSPLLKQNSPSPSVRGTSGTSPSLAKPMRPWHSKKPATTISDPETSINDRYEHQNHHNHDYRDYHDCRDSDFPDDNLSCISSDSDTASYETAFEATDSDDDNNRTHIPSLIDSFQSIVHTSGGEDISPNSSPTAHRYRYSLRDILTDSMIEALPLPDKQKRLYRALFHDAEAI